tara:strand:- start:1267 stop:1569 length:303 start_codon:yes stop_codon:yes gene_type:complete
MIKFATIVLIFFLILFTAFIKNSTKKLEDEIYIKQENLRSLNKDFQNVKLEFNYLSSSERLMEFKELYLDNELIRKNIDQIEILDLRKKDFKIKKFEFNE